MSRARGRTLLLALTALALAAAALAFTASRPDPAPAPAPRDRQERPPLLLLTSLPLLFGEEFSLEGGGSPALTALERRYKVMPISTASPAELARGRLLLMAHPLPQAPEHLVALDEWVRAGGHVLLLADPMLEWASTRPLGDALRPPPMFADTGLLARWGLRLDAPDERGPRQLRLGQREVLTASPGALSGKCAIAVNRLVAHCALGSGHATIVADADLLATDQLDGATDQNLNALLDQLARLEQL